MRAHRLLPAAQAGSQRHVCKEFSVGFGAASLTLARFLPGESGGQLACSQALLSLLRLSGILENSLLDNRVSLFSFPRICSKADLDPLKLVGTSWVFAVALLGHQNHTTWQFPTGKPSKDDRSRDDRVISSMRGEDWGRGLL